jgi:hypothetical protein
MDDHGYLEQFRITSGTQIQPSVILTIVDAHCVTHRMFDVRIGNAVLPSGWMDCEKYRTTKSTHATSLTSKVGTTRAPAPPSKAKIRLTYAWVSG